MFITTIEENTFRRGSRYFQGDTARKMRENTYLPRERGSYFSLNRDSVERKGVQVTLRWSSFRENVIFWQTLPYADGDYRLARFILMLLQLEYRYICYCDASSSYVRWIFSLRDFFRALDVNIGFMNKKLVTVKQRCTLYGKYLYIIS